MSFPFVQPYFGLGNSLQTAQASGGGAGGIGGWVELARTTLGGAADEIEVGSLADKRYYMFLIDAHDASGNPEIRMDFNSDTGSNYSERAQSDGGSDYTATNATFFELNGSNNNNDRFDMGYISNLATKEKLLMSHHVANSGLGAGSAPQYRTELVGKWANTSNAISTIRAHFVSSRTYGSGSELVVLGWDPADTHTSNFWEELASVDLSGGDASSLSTGTITAKKYLWVQFLVEVDTTNDDCYVRFNSDTGSNYSWRRSTEGGADSTSTSKTSWDPEGSLQTSQPMFVNMFVVNNTSNEKLGIAHTIRSNTAGAGNAPSRREWVGKWANTSNQITNVSLVAQSGNLKSKTIMRVWGSN
jgi:hypothetical protein